MKIEPVSPRVFQNRTTTFRERENAIEGDISQTKRATAERIRIEKGETSGEMKVLREDAQRIVIPKRTHPRWLLPAPRKNTKYQ